MRLRPLPATLCVLAATAGSASAKPPASFDPLVEAKNFAITIQRQAIYDTRCRGCREPARTPCA